MTTTACAHAPAPDAGRAAPERRLYVGPGFWTADPGAPDHAAVLVGADGRIERLYEQIPEPAPEGARVVELPGALALPGLQDAHLHLAWIGRSRETVNLRGATSPAEARERVLAFAAAHPEVPVITGTGWDQSRFPGRRFPTAADLGGIERRVVLSRVDGHAVWTNAPGVAAVAAHLAARGEQPGERILRGEDGAPTGVVVDPSEPLREALAAPEGTAADRARWLANGLDACAAAGLTAVHDMATSVAELEALIGLARERGRLPVRVNVYLDDDEASWAWLDAHPVGLDGAVAAAPHVRVLGVKIFADGALGSRGAALKAPYADEPDRRGQLVPADTLAPHVQRAHAAGLQIAVHAIGDAANALALDLIAAAQGDERGARHRIEHVQVLDPADRPRLVALGVVASMQPTHATSDMRWAEDRLGPARMGGAYAWRSLLEAGAPLAFGSDAPIESWSPMVGIHAAVTRRDADGQPAGGWRIEEAVAVDDAVRAYTRGAAFAAREELTRGRLAPGRPFDVTILDRDPRSDAREWLRAKAVATAIDGRVRRARR